MTRSKRAIVVRMDAEGRTQVRRFLEKHGYQVDEAANGADGLDLARGGVPDLVLADGVLPRLSGFELCREVKQLARPAGVPVVLVLEEGDSYGRGRARAEGADLVVSEPLLDEDLADVLNLRPEDEAADDILAAKPGTRDRFLKELLRGAPGRNEPIVSRISDPLTGLHHKGYMSLKLEEEFKKSRRYGQPLAILLVEIDNFADAARTHGKPVAHEMLLEVAGIFLCESRDVDCAGRVDEARFMLLLPNTDLSGARIMADRVFQQVCKRAVRAGEKEVAIRASVGIAALPNDEIDGVADFAERALRAMRMAANMGGNRICAWGDGRAVEK